MNRLRLVVCLFALTAGLSAGAVTFEELRKMPSGSPLSGTLDGIVISDWRSANTELNPNEAPDRVRVGESMRTAYVESFDGRFGVRIKFPGIYENRLERGDAVRITLDGAVLLREEEPERYTLEPVHAAQVQVVRKGIPLPVKSKHIRALTDEDVYTYVQLEGIEMMQKQGGYINILETCAQRTELNRYSGTKAYADGWASLLLDDEGASLYMMVNSTCLWRRNNPGGVKKGVGSLCGILVHNDLPRYATPLGRYQIRPMDLRDIRMPAEEASSYGTVAAWTWNFNSRGVLSFEKAGDRSELVTGVTESRRVFEPRWQTDVRGDRIPAETGKGFLYTDGTVDFALDHEFDARHSFDGWKSERMHGARSYAALRLNGNCPLFLETSTKGLKDKALSFEFSFLAGGHHSKNAVGYARRWKVAWSTDGVTFTDLPGEIGLTHLCHSNMRLGRNYHVMAGPEAAMGFMEHHVALPAELADQDRIILRLAPAEMPGPVQTEIIIRFGMFAVKYLK